MLSAVIERWFALRGRALDNHPLLGIRLPATGILGRCLPGVESTREAVVDPAGTGLEPDLVMWAVGAYVGVDCRAAWITVSVRGTVSGKIEICR